VKRRGDSREQDCATAPAIVLQPGSLASSPAQSRVRPVEGNATRKWMDQESRGEQQGKKSGGRSKRHHQKGNSDSEGLKVTD
jgi:hypothetical protein